MGPINRPIIKQQNEETRRSFVVIHHASRKTETCEDTQLKSHAYARVTVNQLHPQISRPLGVINTPSGPREISILN